MMTPEQFSECQTQVSILDTLIRAANGVIETLAQVGVDVEIEITSLRGLNPYQEIIRIGFKAQLDMREAPRPDPQPLTFDPEVFEGIVRTTEEKEPPAPEDSHS